MKLPFAVELADVALRRHSHVLMNLSRLIRVWLLLVLFVASSRADDVSEPTNAPKNGAAKVVVIPVRDQIAEPVFYVIRRGLKEAIDDHVQLVVLDMETPGGALDVTFDILKAINHFPGEIVTYVNSEAMSAGALIAAGTDEIYFAPRGVIGAAAPVMSTGGDLDSTMRSKIVSYLKARVRAMSEGKGYRGQVISAMIDTDTEFKIGETVIKPKGELLSLTAKEAMREYGDPPSPLLGAGIAPDLKSLVAQKLGTKNFYIEELEVSWSERLAQYLVTLSPLILAAGLVCLFIEFKTPGFGVFGVTGAVLLAVVFFGHYVAGFSGHEPAIIFALGILLVGLEIFVFPGTVLLAVAGAVLMLGSLLWSMADIWPNEPLTLSGDVLLEPLRTVGLALLLAFGLMVVLVRFLPRRWIWDRLVLQATVRGATQMAGVSLDEISKPDELIGKRGVAVTGLYPSGQVEIADQRYDAQVAIGSVERGTPIVVTGRSEFGLRVEIAES